MASSTHEPVVYRLHPKATRFALIVSIILAWLIIPLPYALACFLAACRSKLVLHEKGMEVTYLFTRRIRFDEIERLGLLPVPVPTRGIGAYLARMECSGEHRINLCVMDRRGKTRWVPVSLYEGYLDFLHRVQQAVDKPYEEVALGAFHFKWPADAAAGR
jgi:hypothetical protein